jgi:cold shock CspA family protein
MAVRTIKIFDKEKKCGCVQDDSDRSVYFFHRGCITPNYLPRKGDRIAFNVRTNPRGGGLEAFNFELLAAG